MTISQIIALLEAAIDEEGDIEVFIYDSRGDIISPRSIETGCVSRSGNVTDYAYFSDLV